MGNEITRRARKDKEKFVKGIYGNTDDSLTLWEQEKQTRQMGITKVLWRKEDKNYEYCRERWRVDIR